MTDRITNKAYIFFFFTIYFDWIKGTYLWHIDVIHIFKILKYYQKTVITWVNNDCWIWRAGGWAVWVATTGTTCLAGEFKPKKEYIINIKDKSNHFYSRIKLKNSNILFSNIVNNMNRNSFPKKSQNNDEFYLTDFFFTLRKINFRIILQFCKKIILKRFQES